MRHKIYDNLWSNSNVGVTLAVAQIIGAIEILEASSFLRYSILESLQAKKLKLKKPV